jgi:hypothetical protein
VPPPPAKEEAEDKTPWWKNFCDPRWLLSVRLLASAWALHVSSTQRGAARALSGCEALTALERKRCSAARRAAHGAFTLHAPAHGQCRYGPGQPAAPLGAPEAW